LENKKLTPEDFIYMQGKVLEWNILFGNDPSNKELISVYDGLVKEELNETLKAFEEVNEPEIIDGLCDLMYVAGFRWLLEDVELDDLFLQNLHKGYHTVNDVLEVLDDMVNGRKYIYSGYTLQTLVVKLLYLGSEKYNILEAFNRVTESNFSKAISKEDVILGKIDLGDCIESVENERRYEEVYFESCGEYYIIKAKVDKHEDKVYPTGKVCKGDWYKSVEDLGGLGEFIY